LASHTTSVGLLNIALSGRAVARPNAKSVIALIG
jgi:hypothetical protein